MNNMMLAGLKHQFSHTFSADAQFTWAQQHGYRLRPVRAESLSV